MCVLLKMKIKKKTDKIKTSIHKEITKYEFGEAKQKKGSIKALQLKLKIEKLNSSSDVQDMFIL